eukprot:m.445609 g.445609  ORF g.445609 m.445609 type:complete len:182 (+) comp19255_c0_seq1:228-773(+)
MSAVGEGGAAVEVAAVANQVATPVLATANTAVVNPTAPSAVPADNAGKAAAASAADAASKRSKAKITQLKELLQQRLKEKESLQVLEAQIYAMEGSYLEDTQSWGNIFRGWEGYTSTKSQGRPRRYKESDRLFSSSSLTAPNRKSAAAAAEEDEEEESERRKRKKDKHMLDRRKRMRGDDY